MSPSVLLLSYSGCSTCRRALKLLADLGVTAEVRPMVEEPPTLAELNRWIPASGKPVRQWLNTSGQSYRVLGKQKVEAASDAELRKMLSADGKLVKRPVLVQSDTVFVGLDEDAWRAHFG